MRSLAHYQLSRVGSMPALDFVWEIFNVGSSLTICCEFEQAIALFDSIFSTIYSLTSLFGSIFATAAIMRQDRDRAEIRWFSVASASYSESNPKGSHCGILTYATPV